MPTTLPNDNINPNEESQKFARSTGDAKTARSEQDNNPGSKQEPFPLQREMLPPRPYPFDALGPILGDAAKRCCEIIQAPDAICAQSFLAVASLLVQAHRNVGIDGRYYPLSLFLLTIGESGSRKSAVDGIALSPILAYEKMLVDVYEKDQQRYELELSIFKERMAKNAKAKTPNEEAKARLLADRPQAPLFPNLLVEEPSFEGLFHLFKNGNPSLGLFSDEGGRMIGGYAMGEDHLLKTSCALSTLWDGKRPLTHSRRGDGTVALYGRRLATHLMAQEVVLKKILSSEILTEQGILARFLVTYPASTGGSRPYKSVDLSEDPILKRYNSRVCEILDAPPPLAQGKANELMPKGIYLSSAAMNRWIQFHDEIDLGLKKDGCFYSVRRMANKLPEQVLRISAVLALFEESVIVPNISLEMIQRGIELAQFYLYEALRIDDGVFVDRDLETAQKLLTWMQKKKKDCPGKLISLREVMRGGGTREVRIKAVAERYLRLLEDYQWVRRPDKNTAVWDVVC